MHTSTLYKKKEKTTEKNHLDFFKEEIKIKSIFMALVPAGQNLPPSLPLGALTRVEPTPASIPEPIPESPSWCSWLNPCELCGRITDHWREIVMLAGVALAVACVVAVFFMELSFWWALGFAALGLLLLLAAYQLRDIPTLSQMKKMVTDLRATNAELKATQQKLENQVETLKEQNEKFEEARIRLTQDFERETLEFRNNNSDLKLTNTALTRNNETLSQHNASLELQITQLKEAVVAIRRTLVELSETGTKLTETGDSMKTSLERSLVALDRELGKSTLLCQEFITKLNQDKTTFTQGLAEVREFVIAATRENATTEKLRLLQDLRKELEDLKIQIAIEKNTLVHIHGQIQEASSELKECKKGLQDERILLREETQHLTETRKELQTGVQETASKLKNLLNSSNAMVDS